MKTIGTLLAVSLLATGCDSRPHQQPMQMVQPPEVYQQQPMQYAPQPVIINQQPAHVDSGSSGLASFAAGAAIGAAAGHLLTKDAAPKTTPDITAAKAPAVNHMDTAKFGSVTPTPVAAAVAPKPASMDMSKFNTPKPMAPSRPGIALSKSSMNMSKLSRR